VHDGHPLTYEPVKQGRFTDIRPSNNSNYWQHRLLYSALLTYFEGKSTELFNHISSRINGIMIQKLYLDFGFLGSIAILLFVFFCFVFWIAGISGLADQKKSSRPNLKLLMSVFVPPFPIIWLIYDMYRQNRRLKGKEI
jgi:hypothetical protein